MLKVLSMLEKENLQDEPRFTQPSCAKLLSKVKKGPIPQTLLIVDLDVPFDNNQA